MSRSTLNFETLEELSQKIEALKNSHVKRIALIRDEINTVNPIAVRNVLLDQLSETEVEVIMYI